MIWATLADTGSTTCAAYKRCDEGRKSWRTFAPSLIGQFNTRMFSLSPTEFEKDAPYKVNLKRAPTPRRMSEGIGFLDEVVEPVGLKAVQCRQRRERRGNRHGNGDENKDPHEGIDHSKTAQPMLPTRSPKRLCQQPANPSDESIKKVSS